MTKLFVIWVLTMNAQTGEILESYPEGKPMSAEACLKEIVGTVSETYAGRVRVFACREAG